MSEWAAAIQHANEYSAATLLAECFEFQAINALAAVRTLRAQFVDNSSAP